MLSYKISGASHPKTSTTQALSSKRFGVALLLSSLLSLGASASSQLPFESNVGRSLSADELEDSVRNLQGNGRGRPDEPLGQGQGLETAPGQADFSSTGTSGGTGGTTGGTTTETCTSPTIVSPTAVAQAYTITDNALEFSLSPKFSAESACTASFTFSVTGEDAAQAAELEGLLSFDSTEQKFTLAQISDSLALAGGAGNEQKDFQVAVTFSVGDGTTTLDTSTVTYDLAIKNPCSDSRFVSITAPDFDA